MATESLDSAKQLSDHNCLRSSASRAYYASYQAVTALLHHANLQPPAKDHTTQGEAWSHAKTPDVFKEHGNSIGFKPQEKNQIASDLQKLYKLRTDADYVASSVPIDDMKPALRTSGKIVKAAQLCLQK